VKCSDKRRPRRFYAPLDDPVRWPPTRGYAERWTPEERLNMLRDISKRRRKHHMLLPVTRTMVGAFRELTPLVLAGDRAAAAEVSKMLLIDDVEFVVRWFARTMGGAAAAGAPGGPPASQRTPEIAPADAPAKPLPSRKPRESRRKRGDFDSPAD